MAFFEREDMKRTKLIFWFKLQYKMILNSIENSKFELEMKYLLISIDENVKEPEATLKSMKGILDVELVSSNEFDFSKISLPGPLLSQQALEKLAEEMNTDVDVLNEQDALAYLEKLRNQRKG